MSEFYVDDDHLYTYNDSQIEELFKIKRELKDKKLTTEIIDQISKVIFSTPVTDNEAMHLFEDTINMMFINQIADNILDNNEIKQIAVKLDYIIRNNKYTRWYA